MSSAFRLILSFGTTRVFTLLLTFVTSILTARLLGPSARGTLAVELNFIVIGTMLLNFSVGDWLFSKDAKLKIHGEKDTVFGSIILLSLMSVIVVLVVDIILIQTRDNHHSFFAAILIALIVGLSVGEWLLRGYMLYVDKVASLNWSQIIGRSTTLVFTFILLTMKSNAFSALVALFLGQTALFTISIYFLRSVAKPKFSMITSVRFATRALPIHIGLIGAIALSQADQFIIGSFTNHNQIAFYQIAAQLVSLTLIIPQSISLYLFNRTSKTDLVTDAKTYKSILALTFLYGVLACIITFFGARLAILLVYGNAFLPVANVLKILMLGIFGQASMAVMGSQWVIRGLGGINSVFTITVAVINIFMCLYYLPKYGILAAAWISAGCYSLIFAFNIIVFLALQSDTKKLLRKAS